MANNYQLSTLVGEYVAMLADTLVNFPYIDVRSESDGSDPSVVINWPLSKPPEISRLYVEITHTQPREIWLTGEFYLPSNRANRLSGKPVIHSSGNPRVSYGNFPYNIPKLDERLQRIPFEKDTKTTLRYRVSETLRDFKRLSQRVHRLDKGMQTVLSQAPISLILSNQELFDRLYGTVGELLRQLPLHRLTVGDIDNLSEAQLPKALASTKMSKQLKSGK